MIIVGESLGDLSTLSNSAYEKVVSGELRIYMCKELNQDEIRHIQDGTKMTFQQDCRILRTKLKENINSLAVISEIVPAVTSNVVGWQLFSNSITIPLWGWLLGATTLGIVLSRRKMCLGTK